MSAFLRETSGDMIADRRYAYAMAAKDEGDLGAAEDLLAQTLECVPHWPPAWFALGEVRLTLGKPVEAAAAFEEVVRLDPDDRLGASLHLHRLQSPDHQPPAMSDAYIATLFDAYAPRFDAALRDGLGYCGPEALRDALVGTAGRKQFGAALDLGCGTGLVAEAFAGQFSALEGVDLSAQMIARARQRGGYSALHVAPIADFLARYSSPAFDVVIAADVFVYVDALAPVIGQCAAVLHRGGWLAFTVETHGGEGVVLGEQFRYRHGRHVVEDALARAGLTTLVLEPVSTRREKGAPVAGLLAIARKPD